MRLRASLFCLYFKCHRRYRLFLIYNLVKSHLISKFVSPISVQRIQQSSQHKLIKISRTNQHPLYRILSWTIKFTLVRMRIFNARCLLCRADARRNDIWHASFNLRCKSTLDPSNHLTAMRTSIYGLGQRFQETQDLVCPY